MAREGGAARGARLDGRARPAVDEGLGDLDVAGARELIEMGAEIAVAPVRLFRRLKSSPSSPASHAVSAAITRRRTG